MSTSSILLFPPPSHGGATDSLRFVLVTRLLVLMTSLIAVGLLVRVIVLGPLYDENNPTWVVLNANALMAVREPCPSPRAWNLLHCLDVKFHADLCIYTDPLDLSY